MSKGAWEPRDQLDAASRDFLNIVRRMRESQQRYVLYREQSDLIESKRLEKIVDESIIQETMGLFGGGDGKIAPSGTMQKLPQGAGGCLSCKPQRGSVHRVQLEKVHGHSRRSGR